MYFTECARLAERHPDLKGTIQKVDVQLEKMGVAAVIRPAEFASLLGADPHQVGSVLDMLAQAEILKAEEMIECEYCEMPVLRSDYNAVLEEEEEYRCTSCDRPWDNGAGAAITTYRSGKKWRTTSGRQPGPGGADIHRGDSMPRRSSGAGPDEEAWYTPDRLAELFHVGLEALRARLYRYRKNNLNGWKENEDRRRREAKYLYRLREVKPIIEDLKASSQRPPR